MENTIEKMKIKSLGTNQTEINNCGTSTLVSYETPVAQYGNSGLVLSPSWDCSRTTAKHVSQWTGNTSKETREKIKSGEIQVKEISI